MSKVYFFKVFSSFRAVTYPFWSKDWKPFCKNCRWFKHTFLQKSSFFEFFSIWEENCVADIINRTIKCDLFVGTWCKDVSLGQTYLPTKVVFFSSSSAFEKKIVCPTSLKERLIVTSLLANGVKKCRWVKHTFLQMSSFFWLLQHLRTFK